MQLLKQNASRSSPRSGSSEPETIGALVEMIAADDNDITGADWQPWRGKTGRLISGVRVTATSLTLPEDLEYDDWEDIGGTLQDLARSKERNLVLAEREIKITNWWIADWINFGDRKYGEKYAQAIELTRLLGPELKEQTLANIASVGKQFTPDRRRADPAITWSHHAEVAYLEPQQADAILDRVEAEGLSSRDVRSEVVRQKDKNNGDDPDEAAAIRALQSAAEKLVQLAPERWAPLITRYLVFGIGYHIPPDDDWFAFLEDVTRHCADLATEHCGCVLTEGVKVKLTGWTEERALERKKEQVAK